MNSPGVPLPEDSSFADADTEGRLKPSPLQLHHMATVSVPLHLDCQIFHPRYAKVKFYAFLLYLKINTCILETARRL